MASIFKRNGDRHEPYTIQYFDHQGKRRTKKAFTDKGLTEQLAGKLESDARLRTSGLIDPEQDSLAVHRQTPIEEHLNAFQESLTDNTTKYVKLTMSRVRRVVEGCGFTKLADLNAETVQIYLRSLRKAEDGIGHRTYNHYLQALDAFCHWCVATNRLLRNPLIGVERLNTAVDVRHPRRALTAEQVAKLVESARSSRIRIQGYTGEERARIYLLSYMTGLRKKEIASLMPRSFALHASPPTVTVEAACSKHRRKDVLPLHPDLVVMLPGWIEGLTAGQKLFPRLERRKTCIMVKKDLVRVGIPYETADGIADFHAAGRHTHITELLRNGVSLPEAKELARHSDINMTMRYAHIGIRDQAKAIVNLPVPRAGESANKNAIPFQAAALHGRCILCSAKSHSMTLDGNGEMVEKRQNPCRCKGFVADRRQLSPTGKMEAAGIEPASRDISMTASTCVDG